MKSGGIPRDNQSPEVRPAASVDSRYRLDKSSSAGDEDLDLEVNRFLESEFFADHGYALASSVVQPHPSEPSTSNLPDERMFMDIDESFDMPDLDFDDVSEAFGDSSSYQTAPPSSSSSCEARELRGSLRVHIPASALFGPRQTAPVCEPSKKAPRSTSSTRSKRRKEEMEYLRQQVQEFEDKLEQLRQSALKSGGSSPSPCSSSAMEIESGMAEPTRQWELIAKSEKTEKQKSEAENAKLKKALEGQLKVAKSLSNILGKQQNTSWLEFSRPGKAKKNLCAETAEDGNSQFKVLEVQVEALYTQLDSVLDGIGVVDADMEGHSEQVKTDESGNIFMEVVDSTAMPFDVHTVGAAIWKLMSASSLNFGNRQYQTLDASDDAIRAQVSLDMRLQRHETSIRMWVVGKRIVEAGRIVFVWSAMGDTECSLFGRDRIKIRESAWTVITAGSGSEVNGDFEDGARANRDQHKPVTIVQNVVRMTPELQVSTGSSTVSEDHVGVLTDVVLSSFRRNLATMGQMIENIILSDAATRAND